MAWNFHWLLLYILLGQMNIHSVITSWPSSRDTSIRLLGLMHDNGNISQISNVSIHSRAMFKAAIVLSQQYDITVNGQFIEWQISLTNGNSINVLNSTCQAISTSTIVGIVGPVLSREAHVLADFGQATGIPIVSYAATDPDLSDRDSYPAFYRTIPSDKASALAIMKLFRRYNWTSCVVIYQNDEFGLGAIKVISDTFLNHGLLIKDVIVFNIATKKIRGSLKTFLRSSSTRIVILWAHSIYINMILQEALDDDLVGPHFTWILSSKTSLSSFHSMFHKNLIGILTVEPVTGHVIGVPINDSLLYDAYDIWNQYEPESFPGPGHVSKYALFAFDATWSLIEALHKLSSSVSFIESSYCFNRRFVHSNLLFNAINSIEFTGVSGPIQFSSNTTDRISGLYYHVLNIQPSETGIDFVSVLKYTDSGEWKTFRETNIIIWPGITLTPPSGRTTLAGVTLRIGMIEKTPFTRMINITDPLSGNITTKFNGYMPDLIELLREQIGFIPDIKLAPSNQTYNGLVEAVSNGIYDIVIADVAITSKRRHIVDFSDPIFVSTLRIMIRKETNVNIDLLSYLKPFSYNLWLLILASIIYATILFYILERSENDELKNRSIISALAMSFWFAFSTFVGYGSDFQVKTAAGRLLTAGLYILSLIILASYTANLASNLTISKTEDILSGIEDIKNGKIPFHRIGLHIGTSIEDYYLREVSKGNKNFYGVQKNEEFYDALLTNKIDAAILDVSSGEYATNNIYCNLTLIGNSFYPTGVGLVMPKQWLYKQDLDVQILLLKETGKLDQLKTKWFQPSICATTVDNTTSMKVTALAGLFLTFAIITILSILLCLWKKRSFIRDYLLRVFWSRIC
ncbi:hypothetical protein I4U23_011223 [Adineta vaga]|nr:hypothetical protein I4U23_011223 [Adineta vaga]